MKRIGKKDKNKEKLRSKQRQSRREKERELPDVSLSRSGERLSSRKNLPVTGGGARYLNAALSRTENLPGAKFSHIPLFPGSKCSLYVLTLGGLVFFFLIIKYCLCTHQACRHIGKFQDRRDRNHRSGTDETRTRSRSSRISARWNLEYSCRRRSPACWRRYRRARMVNLESKISFFLLLTIQLAHLKILTIVFF